MATKFAVSADQSASRSRDEWRQIFFDEIDSNAEFLERENAAGDDLRRLSPAVIDMLRNSDLRLLKYPAELGGAEADNALQFEVFERLAYYNAAASWCLFIYTDLIGRMAAFLPQEGVDMLFADDLPLICGGGGMILGDLTPVEGGYRVSGRWVYGSGIDGAEWVVVTAAVKDQPGPPEIISLLVPKKDIEIIDNWHVLGMRASGSSDFTANDVFVPEALTFRFGNQAQRGGAIFALGMIGYISHTVPATAMGIARRALDEITGIAKAKMRGYGTRTPLAQRGVFQAYVAESDLKLRAARALMIENGLRIVADATSKGTSDPAIETEARAAGYYVTKLAVSIVDEAVRFSGSEGIRQGGRIEQALRDVHVASTHYAISDVALESHAQFILGIEGANPMA